MGLSGALHVMSDVSKSHRKTAATHLRASRKATTKKAKDDEAYLAAGYKSLADNEEWLSGERRRSKRRVPTTK